MKTFKDLKAGDKIYYLSEYPDFSECKVLKIEPCNNDIILHLDLEGENVRERIHERDINRSTCYTISDMPVFSCKESLVKQIEYILSRWQRQLELAQDL